MYILLPCYYYKVVSDLDLDHKNCLFRDISFFGRFTIKFPIKTFKTYRPIKTPRTHLLQGHYLNLFILCYMSSSLL